MTDNEITMTSAEFKPPKKRKAIYPHIVVGGKVDDPYYSIHWYDVEEGRMIEGYSSFSLKYVREWLEECFEVVEDDIEPLINRQKAEIEALINGQETLQKYIAEQKAEIERLKRKLVGYEPSIDSGLFSQMLLEQKEKAEAFEKKWKAEVKSEAYREFAERSEKELFIKQNEHREHWMETLNQHRSTKAYKDYEWSIDNWLRGYGEAVQDILGINQEFLKELVGEDDG